MEPEWLPYKVAENFRRMDVEGLLDAHQRAFFTDSKLKKFWGKVDKYLSGVQADYRSNAADHLVENFLTPLRFGYGETGKASRPTFKINLLEAQKKADQKIEEIAALAGKLANALEDLEKITRFVPDETSLLVIIEPLIGRDAVKNLPSYHWRGRTSEALRILEDSFGKYPKANDLFNEVPGMASQKSSWADWMREAESNIEETLGIWPGKLQLKESDWVNLAQVLIGEHITREAVQAARRSCNPQPK